MAEADALSPLVVGFGPIFDSGVVDTLSGSVASLDPVASIDAVVSSDAVASAEAAVEDAFDSLTGTGVDPQASTLLQSLAAIELEAAPVESFDVLASLGVDVDLGFGTGVSAGLDAASRPSLDASVSEAADASLVETSAPVADALDASLVDFSIDTATADALGTDLVGESVADDLDGAASIEAWDAEYQGIAASDPSGDDPAELGLDDY